MGRFITMILSCLHNLLIQVPQNGYHNISRVVQPQIRNISDGLTAASPLGRRVAHGTKDGGIELQNMKSKRQGATGRVQREGNVTTAASQ